MEQIATDTYSFDKLRNGGFVYVDKAAILEKLANGKIGSQFFIARPRRFGKSLAVSTLQCLFEGRRDHQSRPTGRRFAFARADVPTSAAGHFRPIRVSSSLSTVR